MNQWVKVRRSLEHKPFHRESKAHQKFLRTTLKQLEELQERIDVSKEIQVIAKQL